MNLIYKAFTSNHKLFFLSQVFFLTQSTFAQVRFGRAIDYQIGNSLIQSVTIADINNDCLNDVLVMNGWGPFTTKDDHNVQLFLQNTNGQLINTIKFYYTNSNLGNFSTNSVLKVADFNNDNINDIVITFGDTLRIFYQNTFGNFQNSTTIAFNYTIISSMDIGDINNDGFTDIVLGGSPKNSNELKLDILYQQSNSSFIDKSYTIPRNSLSQIKIANLDNDCNKDVVVILNGQVTVLYLNSDSTKNKIISKFFSFRNSYHTFNGFVVGRYGKDRKNSLLISTGGNSSVNYQIETDTSGIINDTFTYFNGGQIPTQVGIADFDNDGLNEIVVAHQGWNYITVYSDSSNVKYNSFEFISTVGNLNTASMDVGDVNNDGLPDVVIANQRNNFRVHYNTSNPKIPILNHPQAIFDDCQTLKSDTIFQNSYFNKPSFSSTSGCNINIVDSYKITKKHLIRYGIGDSLYYPTFCKKNPVYIKKDVILTKINFISIDTNFYQMISKEISFPKIIYSISGLKEICESSQLNLSFQKNSSFNYKSKWYLENDSLDFNSFKLNNLNAGSYRIPYKIYLNNNNIYCAKYDTIEIKVNQKPSDISIIGNDTVCEGQGKIPFYVNSIENNTYNWTVTGLNININNQSLINLEINTDNSIVLFAQEMNKFGCYGNISQKNLFVKNLTDCIFIPNIFTPNYDGINDIFEIKKLELYPENNLKIYNRWGTLVYQTNNYNGTWDAKTVSDGVYYYVFEVNFQKTIKGWIEVIR